VKLAGTRPASIVLPLEPLSDKGCNFELEASSPLPPVSPPATPKFWFVPCGCAFTLYTATFFVCMIIVDFTIEGTQNAFPDLKALPYAMTLFQFGFCLVLPVVVSKGKTLKNLPTSMLEISPYIVLSLVVFGSNVCKSASARYVSFPTKVIFRSTKLIPVMIVASMLRIGNQRRYGKLDFLAALLLCAGAAGYSFGEHTLNDDKEDSYFGILLLTGSVLCDAFTPNIKEWLMNPSSGENPAVDDEDDDESAASVDRPETPATPESLSRNQSSSSLASTTPSMPDVVISDSGADAEDIQLIPRRLSRKRPRLLKREGMGLSATSLMTNAYAVGCTELLLFMTITGHLNDTVGAAMVRPHLIANLSLIGMFLSIAVFAHTRIIKESGAVTAVTVTTLREFVTVLLSYLVYPKIFSSLHAVSTMLVFGGILLSSYTDFNHRPHNRNSTGGNTVAAFSPARKNAKP